MPAGWRGRSPTSWPRRPTSCDAASWGSVEAHTPAELDSPVAYPMLLSCPLRGNDDYAVRSARAIRARRRRVLEDVDLPDVARRELGYRGTERPARHRDAVDHQ